MKAWATQEALNQAANETNVVLEGLRKDGNGWSFVLRPEKGENRNRWEKRNPMSGRLVFAVCFCGHFAFLKAVFAKEPGTTIKSALATFNGQDQFLAEAWKLRHHETGSVMYPYQLQDECAHD